MYINFVFRTTTLSENLSRLNFGNDEVFLNKMQKNIFQKHLDSYFMYVFT